MKILAVYAVYIWVGLLHAFFVGTCLYVWAGKWLVGKAWWLSFVMAFLILAFFETYWIPIFDYIGLKVSHVDAEMRQTFGVQEGENIIRNLSPRWGNVLFWGLQASIAVWISRILLRK